MGPSYEALREQYVDELRTAKDEVSDWWSALVAVTFARLGSPEEAEKDLRRRWPVGPAAHPRILGIVRKYFLACDALNQQVRARIAEQQQKGTLFSLADPEQAEEQPDQPLSPGVLIEESLSTKGSYDLGKIVGRLSYWPIGVDAEGRFV